MATTTIEAEEARRLLAAGEARALDVRPEDEMAAGHAPGAVHASPDDLDEAAERVLRGERAPLLVFSADGERAAEVADTLREQGHEAAAVKGGWENWLSEGMPVQPAQDEEFEGPDLLQPGVTTPSGPASDIDEGLAEEEQEQDEQAEEEQAEDEQAEDEQREQGEAEQRDEG